MSGNIDALNEDELHISKQDVIDMIQGLILRSRKNSEKAKSKGLKSAIFAKMYRDVLIGFKTVVRATPHQPIEAMWSDILKFFNVLIIRNKMAQEMKQVYDGSLKQSPLQITFASLVKDVKEGNW